jgi:hypothetical protein
VWFPAENLSGLPAAEIFPWESDWICAVVEQAQRTNRMRRQKPHRNDGMIWILSRLTRVGGLNPYGF